MPLKTTSHRNPKASLAESTLEEKVLSPLELLIIWHLKEASYLVQSEKLSSPSLCVCFLESLKNSHSRSPPNYRKSLKQKQENRLVH